MNVGPSTGTLVRDLDSGSGVTGVGVGVGVGVRCRRGLPSVCGHDVGRRLELDLDLIAAVGKWRDQREGDPQTRQMANDEWASDGGILVADADGTWRLGQEHEEDGKRVDTPEAFFNPAGAGRDCRDGEQG